MASDTAKTIPSQSRLAGEYSLSFFMERDKVSSYRPFECLGPNMDGYGEIYVGRPSWGAPRRVYRPICDLQRRRSRRETSAAWRDDRHRQITVAESVARRQLCRDKPSSQ